MEKPPFTEEELEAEKRRVILSLISRNGEYLQQLFSTFYDLEVDDVTRQEIFDRCVKDNAEINLLLRKSSEHAAE